MILSVSRRTDVPNWYADWFFRRLQEGYVLVRNPMNPRQISRVTLTPDVVDGIVFWSKNPAPMLDRLDLLQDYAFYFQFTLNAYGPDVEAGLPDKFSRIVPVFQRLADRIGPARMVWRYDPILISRRYTCDWHRDAFAQLARRLAPYTRTCTISFLDFYRNTAKNLTSLELQPFAPAQQAALARDLAQIARSYGLAMDTCAEQMDLSAYGIGHARCIDGQRFAALLHTPLRIERDKNQRPACGCMASIDIGAYDSCRNGCRYCYATHSAKAVQTNLRLHDPASPLLIGTPGPQDRITLRPMETLREYQLRLDE